MAEWGHKADANAGDLDEVLRAIGARYDVLPRTMGCDRLVWYRGSMFWVEIKNPAQPPSKRRLTDNEKDRKALVEATRCGVYLVVMKGEELIAKLEELTT